jgi:hypothetical protein
MSSDPVMQNDSSIQPELTCQWCSGTIPENASACTGCGAARPREDLVVPGLTQQEEPSTRPATLETETKEEEDEEARARQILKDLDAYIPEEETPAPGATRDTGDDAIIIVGILGVSAITGGLAGWFVAPPILHDLFNNVIGVDTDGPEAFRRLGGFVGALVTMLFGAMAAAIVRR